MHDDVPQVYHMLNIHNPHEFNGSFFKYLFPFLHIRADSDLSMQKATLESLRAWSLLRGAIVDKTGSASRTLSLG